MKDHSTFGSNCDTIEKSDIKSTTEETKEQLIQLAATKQHDLIGIDSISNAENGSSLTSKKKVNIDNDSAQPSAQQQQKKLQESPQDLDEIHEGTALQHDLKTNQIGEVKYATLSGTIRKGKKGGGQCLDVKVNISRNELEKLEDIRSKLVAANSKNITKQSTKSNLSNYCSISRGPHIFLWTIICFPIVFLISAAYSFYYGTVAWYNILTLFTEEKPFCIRILAAPILILSYPFLIVSVTIGLGIYSAIAQLSFYWCAWISRVQDFEKGFYAWLCSKLHLDDCSPYTVVIVQLQQDENGITLP